ncbi:nuclear pore complex protein nup205 [Plasmopara halstedii]|uniref:Nuclear pore complex protein nup205 n=1 Tax=Plasmopara halstedii TaxID=4781 RepID=A0A0P1AZZ5_PLAHL|nr:nuclear pore complex protein nup205 [Plasmopara halstedii]CEG48013.1 nuclear pore complex protein nup205 [Plasmopara halstedii]|eukprot:XP_024584382.1 nuclear pore complex protein nup205 [Plasmopara halstedii]
MSESLSLGRPPLLRFRLLHQDLLAYVGQNMADENALQFTANLVAAASDLLQPLSLVPPSTSERAALQANAVKVIGKHVEISPLIQQEICKLSDEFRISEKTCFEFWFMASDQQQREWVERADQLAPGTIADSVQNAARYFLISEMEYKLHLLKELLRLRLETQLDKPRAQFIISFTNKLLMENLLPNLVAAYDEQLTQLAQIAKMEQSVSFWHTLVAECLVFIVSSTLTLATEVQKLANLLKMLCGRLQTVVAKVSPHIVNFSSFAELFEGGSLGGTSPEGAVRQVSCILQTITAIQVALFVVLFQNKTKKLDRETGEMEIGAALYLREHAPVVKELHRILYEEEWEQKHLQSVGMLAWAGFLAENDDGNSNSRNVIFAEAEAASDVVKKAIEERVFHTLVEVQLKYVPDRKRDLQLYYIHERHFELLFHTYSSKMMVAVPTVADKASLAALQSENDGEVVAWDGDCLEDIVEFATALCARNSTFCRSFWRDVNEHLDSHDSTNPENSNDKEQRRSVMRLNSVSGASCHDFLIACRDAALKNPGCLAAYIRLVAAAARGPDCAQLAFHHIKMNPQQLGWDHFFAVMAKYQRLLTDAEKPAGYPSLMPGGVSQGIGVGHSSFNGLKSSAGPGPRFIRPKELEALESIQKLIQEVLADSQLALIFFHNHDWSPIPTFVAFLQCRIPSSLKGSIMKTLAAFARVPDIAPFVWRQVDALQILRTTGDTTNYGKEDISYELEHYESLSRTYPATRGFVTLLYELFKNPRAWKSFEGDGNVAAIQYYFEFLLDNVFLKFDLRKYEREEEKWELVNGTLAIFKKLLRSVDTFTTEGSLSYQLLARFLSSNPLLNKVLSIISGDDGVENLESTSTDRHLEHAFFYCLDIVKRETEAKHGSLNFVIDVAKKPSDTYLTKTTAVASLRERCVQHALELILLLLENDVQFVDIDINRQLSHRLQVEMMHTILCRHRFDLVNIVKYIKYSKSKHIPHLSTAILRIISTRISGGDLISILVDSGSGADIMIGYMNRLLNVYDNDEDEQVEDEVESNNEQSVTGLNTGSTQSRNCYQDTQILSSPHELFESDTSPPSIRGAILDLLLENLNKPAPNLAHLLLGNIKQTGTSKDAALPKSYVMTGLEAIITLVMHADFGVETPELAERCHHVLYCLVTQEFSSPDAIAALESVPNDFFASQIQLFSSVYHVSRRKTAATMIAELNMRGWFFKTLAVYLHVGLQKEPPRMKNLNKLIHQLLSVTEGGSRNDVRAIERQEQMLLLRLLDECTFHFLPPVVPVNRQVVAMAEELTAAVGQGCYYKWLKIDIERFCHDLQKLDLTAVEDGIEDFYSASNKRFRVNDDGESSTSSKNNTEAAVERLIQWAIQWNIYSERIAAESHSLNSLRELMEVIVLDYLVLPRVHESVVPPTMREGSDALASEEVRLELMSGIIASVLSKLTDKTGAAAQLFEIAATNALMLFSQLSYTDDESHSSALPLSRYEQSMSFLEMLFRSVYSSAAATGNPSAARNSRTLLYTCILHVLHMLPSHTVQDLPLANVGLAIPARSQEQRIRHLLSNQVVDLICKDASDGEDTLSMALAVSALETLVGFEGNSLVVAVIRERGYLMHFIDILKKLSDMDAAVFERSSGGSTMVKSKVMSDGMDATTIGSIYECFLSLFARVAETRDGAIALLEGGLIRVLSDVHNLPTHLPQHLFQQRSAQSGVSAEVFQRIEFVYYRKWLPMARLLSACCASLPKNRTLTSQILQFVYKNRKLFTSALKLCASGLPSQLISINLLREVSYVTFVFRYVTQFTDLCEQTLVAAKWEKISQLILHVFMYFSTRLVPPSDEADDMSDVSSSTWWHKTVFDEQRTDAIQYGIHEKLLEHCESAAVKSSGSASLLHMSLLDEEKLYASRMILCNAVAFCVRRMMFTVDDNKLGRVPPLLSLSDKTQMQNESRFPSMSSVDPRAFAAATDPLWIHAPSINDFTIRFDSIVFALEASKQLVDALTALNNEAASGRSNLLSSASSQQQLIGRRDLQREIKPLENLLEYHADSLMFVVENMLVVLLCHFTHYLGRPEAASSEDVVHHTLGKVLVIVSEIESNSFIHAIARRLRELASTG